jgi:hypothetical protein
MRSERVIVVFAASPSDLETERDRLEEIVRELNITWSRKFGARLDLVMWETHGYPGIGLDSQEVLNRQLPNDYDIFIGMMWGKFGTPTGRAGSGTEEEYRRAVERFRSEPDRIKVMFYFKDAPLPPSSIDPSQLQRVQCFKSSLGHEGTLHWGFRSLEDFDRLLRLHLSRQMQHFIRDESERAALDSRPHYEQELEDDREDEPGLFELQDLAEESIRDIAQISQRISAEWITYNEGTAKRAQDIKEIAAAIQSTHGVMDRKRAKALIGGLAAEMRRFVERVRPDLPRLRETSRRAADATLHAVLIESEIHIRAGMSPRKAACVQAILTAISQLAERLQCLHNAIRSRKSEIPRMPGLTTEFNRAKRELAETLEEIAASSIEGRSLYLEAEKSLRALLDEEAVETSRDGPQAP